ncbi:MAG: ATP-grasp domain-containing protein [archaeon]|nr:ATP-grasp domain-containing protein [archaeon]
MKKIGLWIPARKNYSSISVEKPGYFIQSFKEDIMKILKKQKNTEIIENLDFRKAVVKNGEVFLNDFCFSDLDVFFWLGEIDRSRTSYHIQILETISKTAKVINNPSALKIVLDKYLSQLTLKQNNIRVPEFLLVSQNNLEQVKKQVESKTFIVKPRFGSFGSGIMKLTDYQNLIDIVDYSEQKSHFLEEFIEFDFEDWIGVNVIDGEIIYGYGKEKSKISGWKVFDRERKGGKMILKKPSKEQKKIALQVAKATGLDFFGVDIIKSKHGQNYVIDINTFPGLYPEMFAEAKVNGAEHLANLILKK